MDHHLVTLARGAGVDPVVEGGLREQGQRIRLLLGHRRRVRRHVYRAGARVLSVRLLIQALAGGGQRLHEQRADLRGQPPADSNGAVRVGIHV